MSTLRWGILSTARINRRLIAAVRVSARSQLVAVASRDSGRADDFAREWDIPVSYGSYEALLADVEVDVVYNPLPNHLHMPWSVRALKAGKHVLCEKPMALSPVQADLMIRAAEQAECVLAEGYMYRHHPRTRRVRQLIESGIIGPLRTIQGAFTFPFDRDSNYRMDPDLGGGALWDVGCYPVSFARYVMGEEPEQVEALSRQADSGVDMAMAGVLRFSNGVLATFDCGFDASFRSEMTFVGTKGAIHVPLAFRPSLSCPVIIRTESGEETMVVSGFEPIFLGEVQDMECAVLDGHSQEIPLRESRDNAATLLALQDAARTGHAERPV